MPQIVTESGATVTPATRAGNMLCQLITPGTGSSGHYPAETLEAAATDRVFPAGTLLFADHPGEHEAFDRPERSIRDVAGVLVEDARWDGGALVAEAKTFAPWTSVLAEMKDAIGMSIRASAEVGEADPATGKPIVKRLVEGISVDFVTKAGRGGAIREVYESARGRATLMVVDETPAPVPVTDPTNLPTIPVVETARSEARETLTDETRTMLDAALNGTGWVMDFDPDASTVVYRREWQEAGEYRSELLQATYQVDGVTATIHDDGVQVRRQTTFVPVAAQQATAEAATTAATQTPSDTPNVPAPAGQSTANESKETTMATTQIEESRLAQLEKDAERVQTLESDHAKQATELAEAHRVIDQGTARDIVRKAAREAGVTVNDFEVAGIAADYPRGENGRIDTDKLAEHARTAVASLAEAHGAGTVTGFGGTPVHTGEVTEADATKAAASAFGRTTKEA